ncbi:unnamed protein product [Cyprideis torosa]|uniref:Uncharacterized protein n=1 Tax=Cyprideis torosa TaxID=163714 RepID=A0A7R8W6W4_9CRUS|nr:unnamed protein product [Cyprideis torosa]CAG0886929.1 unnamed protein product [Cyprideis torosa]
MEPAVLWDFAQTFSVSVTLFSLYIKLFFVMGITWVAEVISWAWGQNDFWYIVDYINALQGVFMFVIFVCKRKTLRYLSRILRGKNPSSGFDYSTSAHDTKSTSLSRPSERGSGGCCLAPAESSEPEGEAGEKECNGGNPPKAPPRRRSSSCCYDEIGEDSRPWEVVLLDGEVRAGRRRHQSERGLCCRETEGSDSPEASLDSPIRESPGVSQGQLMTEASKRRKEFSSGRRKTVSFEDEPCDDNKMALHLASQKIRGTLV